MTHDFTLFLSSINEGYFVKEGLNLYKIKMSRHFFFFCKTKTLYYLLQKGKFLIFFFPVNPMNY